MRFSMSEKRPKQCTHCAHPSAVYLTQIVGGEVTKLDMCANCPMARELSDKGAFDIVGKPSKPSSSKAGKTEACPKCGFTKETFKEFGRLGCPACYDAFASSLEPIFRKLHKGVSHRGKSPAKSDAAVTKEEIESLKQQLQEHVKREEYEQAALLRDRIWELERHVS